MSVAVHHRVSLRYVVHRLVFPNIGLNSGLVFSMILNN